MLTFYHAPENPLQAAPLWLLEGNGLPFEALCRDQRRAYGRPRRDRSADIRYRRPRPAIVRVTAC